MSEPINDVTHTIVEYSLGLSHESIPQQVIEKAKHLFLDYLGVALGGHRVESTPDVLSAVRELSRGSNGCATVLGITERFPSHYAALVNGTLAHSMDFDDTHKDSLIHPGTPVFSVLIPMAEVNHKSGLDFLVATTVGYDVIGKLGRAHGNKVHERGFHPTATTGIFGGVAAGGRLIQLENQSLTNAFGMALSQSAGSLQFLDNGAWNKRVHVGLAAHNAIISLTMARHNILGASNPIEGRFGYFQLYSGDASNAKNAINDLGKDFEILKTAIKPYPCCRYNHSVIDAVTYLADQYSLGHEDVNQIVVELSPVGASIVGEPQDQKRRPDNLVDGQFSVYFAAAIALLHKTYSWDSYGHLDDPAVQSLMKRIHVVTSTGIAELGTKVHIKTNGDNTLTQEVFLAKGEPESPLSWEEVVVKFKSLAGTILNSDQVEAIVKQVTNLEQVEDMADFATLLRPL
jgi:2-methylcitrate dehydratase PrpD